MKRTEVEERLKQIGALRVYGDDGMWELPEDLYTELYELIAKLKTPMIDEDTFNLDNVDI